MTGMRIAITWEGDHPGPSLKESAERAIQKGARSTGCFGSARLSAHDNRIDVSAADLIGAQDPKGGHMRNAAQMVSRWLKIGGVEVMMETPDTEPPRPDGA